MQEIPVWTMVFWIIGALVNTLVLIIGWTINSKLGDIKETIRMLTEADHEMSIDLKTLAKELSDHKVYSATNYVSLPRFEQTVTGLFNRLDKVKIDIIDQVRSMIGGPANR